MLTRISTAGPEPVDLESAKLAARIDGDDLDVLLLGAIRTARDRAEHLTGRAYVASVWRATFARWPAADEVIRVHDASACVITYWNGAEWLELSPAAYVFAPAEEGSGTVIAPAVGTAWPELGEIAVGPRVRVALTNGPGPEGSRPVPDCVKDFIRANVAAWADNPSALVQRQLGENPLLNCLLDMERLWA